MQIAVRLVMRNGANASAVYDSDTKSLVVLHGSKVNMAISSSKSFRSANSICKARSGIVDENGIVMEDVRFLSASTAANFVTGNSTNGLKAWKSEDGRTLGEIIKEEQ